MSVPVVIVLVALVVVTLIVFAFFVFVVPIALGAGSGHHGNRCRQGSSQKKRTEISVSTVHVVLLVAQDSHSQNPTNITVCSMRAKV